MDNRVIGKMILPLGHHLQGKITTLSPIGNVIAAIKRKLTARQLKLFKKDIFGHFLKLKHFEFSGNIVHNVLLRQVRSQGYSEMWFQIGDNLARLSISEWCLVTGLLDGDKPSGMIASNKLRDDYFGGEVYDLSTLDKMFEAFDFENMDDEDALKLSLYYFADRVLKTGKAGTFMDESYLKEVNDLAYFRSLPWGRITWDRLFWSINNKFEGYGRKKQEEVRYNILGLVFGLQAWIFEAIDNVSVKWAAKTDVDAPRILKWRFVGKVNEKQSVVTAFFNETDEWNVRQTLSPTKKEKKKAYASVVPPPIPAWVNRHDPSVNAGVLPPAPDVAAREAGDAEGATDHAGVRPPATDDKAFAEEAGASEPMADELQKDRYEREMKDIRYAVDMWGRSINELKATVDTYGSSVNKCLEIVEEEQRQNKQFREEQAEFRDAVSRFMSSYASGSLKHSVSPLKRSYMASPDRGVPSASGTRFHSPVPIPDDTVQFQDKGHALAVSKFGRAYKPSQYAYSPYVMPQGVRCVRALPAVEPIDLLRGYGDPLFFEQFDKWFNGEIAVNRCIPYSLNFFKILLGSLESGWLTDEHIHAYYRLLSDAQQHSCNTATQRITVASAWNWPFFVRDYKDGSLDMTKYLGLVNGSEEVGSKPLVDVDQVLIPINLDDNHWVLCRANLETKGLFIYDPMVFSRDLKTYKYKERLKPLSELFPRVLHAHGLVPDASPWDVNIVGGKLPQQKGSDDCGVFVLMFSAHITFVREFKFDSSHIPHIRKKIAFDCFNGFITL